MVATVGGVLLWFVSLWHINPSVWVILWAVFSLCSLALMANLFARFAKANVPDDDLRRWEMGVGTLQTVAGLQFGVVGFLVLKDMTLYAPFITIGLLLIVVGSLSLQVTYRPSIVAVAVPVALLHSAAMLRSGELLPSVLERVYDLLLTRK
ncbi:MAG: hypothetical protein HEQ39_03535 [Rhizobacter sp.]